MGLPALRRTQLQQAEQRSAQLCASLCSGLVPAGMAGANTSLHNGAYAQPAD